MNSRTTRVGPFEVCVPTHVALRKFIMRVLASQLHFLTNRNAGLTVPPLLWQVDYMGYMLNSRVVLLFILYTVILGICNLITTFLRNILLHILQKKKIAPKIAEKIPCVRAFIKQNSLVQLCTYSNTCKYTAVQKQLAFSQAIEQGAGSSSGNAPALFGRTNLAKLEGERHYEK